MPPVTLDYQPLDPIKEGLCGAPAPILVKSIGKDPAVEIDPPGHAHLSARAALSAWLKDVVQPDAKALFGSPVIKLHNATSYACRNRYGAAQGPLSEHALANALDVSEFVLASGEQVTVLTSWPQGRSTPPLPAAQADAGRAEPVRPCRAIDAQANGPSRIVEVAKAKAGAPPAPPPVATPPEPASVAEKRPHS